MGIKLPGEKVSVMSAQKENIHFMESERKSIAVMTSGGDAPGMNAAIRGVYSRAREYGYRVLGIRDGFTGLVNDDIIELRYEDVEQIISMGGTILGTSRCPEFKEETVQKKAAAICRKHGISAVVVIGGDGSFQGALRLHAQGIGVIGIPGTIDLDIGCTEYTLGFDTAVNSAMETIDKIEDTSRAHNCYSVVEVMGRRAGYIATHCGIANSARRIIIPEKDTLDHLVDDLRNQNCRYGTIVVAEGAAKAQDVAEKIERELQVHTRVNVLGFLQRGGSPTGRDRVYGCRMGAYAADLIEQGQTCHVVAYRHGGLEAVGIEQALQTTRDFPEELYALGKTISHRFDL